MSTIIDFINKVKEQGVATYNLLTGESGNKKFIATYLGSTERLVTVNLKTEKVLHAYIYEEVADYISRHGAVLHNPKIFLQGERVEDGIVLSLGVSDEDVDAVQFLNHKQKLGE